jgi:hypothetical protein
MPYLNIDDGMYDHAKVDGLSDAAWRLHLTAMMFCARNLTDGFVSRGQSRRLTATASDPEASELVRAEVWHDIGEGCTDAACIEARTCPDNGKPGHYLLHDYLQWNHSKAWWDTRRREEAERKRKYRARKNGGRASDVT